MSDGISVFDAGGPVLRTLMAAGNSSARSLGWYGGGVVASRTSAGIQLPSVLDGVRTVTVQFDAYAGTDFDPILLVNFPACGYSYSVTVRRSYGWQTLSRDIPSCGTMGRVVIYVGDIYEASTSTLALRLDNIVLTYH